MHKLARAALAGAALFAAAPAIAQEEAQIGLDAGNDSLLYGTLLRPEGTATVPFVLIVGAAGPIDQNGNTSGSDARPNTYKLLAEALAARGIGSLRTDKRGVATSAAAGHDEHDIKLDTYVDDTVTWAKFLELQPRVKCVVLLGHSEGALIAALAAHRAKICGLIEAAGASRPAGDLMAAQLKAARDAGDLTDELYDRAVQVLTELRAGRPVADPPLKLDALFRPGLQPYLISWLGRDPVEAEKGVAPLLVLQGDRDKEVATDDARRLANIAKLNKLVVLPGVDHWLRPVPAGKAADAALDPGRPLDPGVAKAIADFVTPASAGITIKLVGAK